MKIDVLSLFPEFFQSFLNWSMINKAISESKVKINNINIRDFSLDKHKKVDDYPFGGGPGMVMTPEPIYRAINSVRDDQSKIVYLSPHGKIWNQDMAKEYAKEDHLILLCGHYEGVDHRIIENYIDEEISMGDFVVTGGELPAMIMIDSIVRLLPGVLSSKDAIEEESHFHGLLEHPQYTRPRVFKDIEVPEILLSGHHANIEKWKHEESLKITMEKRPDLIDREKLSKEDLEIIDNLNNKKEL